MIDKPYNQEAVSNKPTLNMIIAPSIIITVWLIMILAVNPIGDFPINDDWAYAATVKNLLDTGNLLLHDWCGANMVSQIYFGAFFSKLFGFSITTLRISSLFLGLIALLFIYQLIRKFNYPRNISLGIVLMIGVNPIYFAMSNSFMSDIPFFFFSTASLFFLTNALKSSRWVDIGFGSLACILALMVRQLGLAIPIGFFISYLIGNQLTVNNFLKAAIPLVICLAAELIFNWWLKYTGHIPAMHGYQIKLLLDVLASPIKEIIFTYGKNCLSSLIYISEFTSPLLIYYIFTRQVTLKLTQIWFVAACFIIGTLAVILFKFVGWPFLGNIFTQFGIGPFNLNDHGVGYAVPKAVFYGWKLIGIISVTMTGLLLIYFYNIFKSLFNVIRCKNYSDLTLPIFFGSATLIYLMPVIGQPELFDRYLLLPILTTMLFLASQIHILNTKHSVSISIVFIMIFSMGLVSTSMVHDYLNWHRVQWQALHQLMAQQGIVPSRINGDLEFNGTYLFSNKELKPKNKGWWVVDDEYKSAFGNINGYTVDSTYPVNAWLPISPNQVLILRRQN